MLQEQKILSAIHAALGETSAKIIFDGRFHEFDINGKKEKGRYIAHPNGPCTFWDWRDSNTKHTVWPNDFDNDPSDKAERAAKYAAERAAEAAAELRRAATAAANAVAIWNAAPSAPNDHGYLLRKQIAPHFARILTPKAANAAPPWLRRWIESKGLIGALIIPIGNAGQLSSLQFIRADSGKQQLPSGRMRGSRAIIGHLIDAEIIILAEGFATAASIHEATGYPVVVAFDAGNLSEVAAKVRKEHPHARLILAADNDNRAAGDKCQANTGVVAARAAASLTGGLVAIPSLPSGEKCDFNDIAVALGRAEVTRQLHPYTHEANETTNELPSAAEAANELTSALNRFFDHVGTDEKHDLAIRAAAGLGKSTKALQEIHTRALVADYFVPSVALAREQAARLPEGAATVIRGRSHSDANNPPLCAKHEAVTALKEAGLGRLAAPLLCGKVDTATGRRPCPHARECGYLKQFNDQAPIRFYAHEWLTLPEREKRTPDVAVIDESFRDAQERHRAWNIADLFAGGSLYRTLAAAVADENLIEVANANAAAIDAALEAVPLLLPAVHPEMNAGEVIAKLATLDNDTAERRRLGFLRAVKHAAENNTPTSLWHVKNGEGAGKIHAAWIAPIKFIAANVPRLFLDASASASVLDAVSPNVELLDIAARRNAQIIQVADTALSKTRLEADNNYLSSRIIEFITRQAGENPNGSIIAPKSWLAAHSARIPISVKQAHYGALRGLNELETVDWLVVVGRNEPPSWGAEGIARAWFPSEMKPGTVTREQVQLVANSGDVATVTRTTFKDPHCREILESIREQESLQAIDRLRLIHAVQPKKIFLLSNLPLPGLPPDELVALDDLLLPGRLAEVILRDGLIVGPATLSRRHPDLFPTAKAAERQLEEFRGKLNPPNAYKGTYKEMGGLSVVEYRTRGTAGKPRRALVATGLPTTVILGILEEIHGAKASILEVKNMDEARQQAPIDRISPVPVPEFIQEYPPTWEPPPEDCQPILPDPEPWQWPIKVPTEPLYLPNVQKMPISSPQSLLERVSA